MYCPTCGKEIQTQANFCSNCGAALAAQSFAPTGPRILRPRSPRMIAGVCSGFALHFGWDLSLVRILLCVFTFLTSGIGFLFYIAAWVLLPEAPYALPATTDYPNPQPAA
ncbi:PspC domain-containing protein [Granulicella tundricola]|uniref:Phage shock protein C, PspC n=1 Tax=Granulicella tundricola (strain ATCC BAA-1859 / DSM 23138 / MP5ACTX9) TaxID=1198114 RepID=E8X0K9_GRATM|nr:PspC domain-containing protein [Granulicella tundricola]ADW68960.1 phage shock protein C, PspC [Granulicella tundricola MP5ACTX9]